ncbi:CarD family transcriptional regulator [Patescibacteria group bacterium]|nr:CarD family transcriptional regulator [Patescibacteria group bacterium]MBU1702968.1 CarD family transcriptional regulator [Patescibacteria group bacterium]MBU1954015.1 CarD family transcriptional regulator [Patescibacteria group bacterium]
MSVVRKVENIITGPLPEKPALEFKAGDKAVYPVQGVAEVMEIKDMDINGERQSFYVLQILDTNRKIMVPVNKAGDIGVRPIIPEGQIEDLFEIMRENTVDNGNKTWNRRYMGFMAKMKTGSIFDAVEVFRDLYRIGIGKDLAFAEKQMLEKAREFIIKEIAVARGQDECEVRRELEAVFN